MDYWFPVERYGYSYDLCTHGRLNSWGELALMFEKRWPFAAIYLLWGATFLAIRVAVLEIPPLLTAGFAFHFGRNCPLYGWMRARGQPRPA